MTETWLKVVRFSDYEVSNLGRVRSVDREVITKHGHRRRYRGKILGQAIDGHGYHRVCVWVQNRQIGRIVHRLVAESFIREIGDDEEINHIDLDKSNNAPENLEIVSHAYNMAHAAMAGVMKKAFQRRVSR
jgi:hypothetical protein